MPDLGFWISVVGAALIRVWQSFTKSLPWYHLAASFFISIFSAWVFTLPILDLLGRDPTLYAAPVGALIALTAEAVYRIGREVLADPERFIRLALNREEPKK